MKSILVLFSRKERYIENPWARFPWILLINVQPLCALLFNKFLMSGGSTVTIRKGFTGNVSWI